MKRLLSAIVCLVMGMAIMVAQNRTVRGSVTSSEDGEPVIGATVMATGTTTGTTTDYDGKFTISVSQECKTLTISYVGMKSVDALIRGNNMRIVLEPNSQVLDDVVVTAMGISRSEKALGYSATTLRSEELTLSRSTNVTNALQGKVAGVQISSVSSDPGSANNVIIRGFSSINGSNQPLYVVDGVPLQNTTYAGQGHVSSTGGISNISSDDIASMTVLKGAAATALYGSRAANGVVLINTKSGKKGSGHNFTLSYSYGLQARQVSYLPSMQNKWGQGWNGNQTYIENGSWGPALDGSTQVYGPIWNSQQLIHTYSAAKNNVKDFFDVGLANNHNVSLNGMSEDEKMTYYLSYSYTDDDGIMPTDADSYKRNTLSFRSTYEAAHWLKLSSSVSYAKSETDVVGNYQGTSVIDGLYEMPRDISIVDMKNTASAFNTPEAYFTPYGITNPYWALENNYHHIDSKQLYGKVQADINPIKPLTLTYRFGFDYTDYDAKQGYPQIALDDALIEEDYGYAPSNMNQSGYVYSYYRRSYELNHDVMANWHDQYIDKKLDVNVTGGLNVNERYYTRLRGETDDLTFATGFWDLSNGATKSVLDEAQSKRRLIGLWGNVALSWSDKVFLELTARNDWSSTLPIDNNSFFYPGATLSYLFTEDLPENDILTFGKVRLAFGKTGNDADPYKTSSSYEQAFANGYYGSDIAKFPMNGVNAFQIKNTAGSSTLKPEMTTEFEVGANLGFFKGRLELDATFYNRKTEDQIFTLPVDPSTGFSYMVTNFGEVSNKGVELVINTTPIRTKNWRWDLNFNWAKNKNKVVSMPSSLEGGKVNIYSFSAGNDAIYMYAEEGKPMGEFYTYLPKKTDDGKLIVDENGFPVLDTQVSDTGKNMNNDWTGGVTTSLSAYGFTLSAALDIRKGGYMFSRSKNLMQFTGNGIVTEYNERRPFIIPNSVVETENGYVENTTPIYMSNGSYQDYFNDYGWGQGGEAYLVDRSFVKLRNINLTYTLPKKWLNPIYLSEAYLSVFCNNVFTWTAKDNCYVDPESSTTAANSDLEGQFGELYANPSCRVYGFNVGIKF